MKVIEITENKLKDMSSHVEDILELGGKLMLCLEKLSYEMYGEKSPKHHDDEYMHERRMNMRYRDEDDMWNERRYGNRYR